VSKDARLAPIRFGTDGWRAVIADEFTFANVERVAQAYAAYVIQQFTHSRPRAEQNTLQNNSQNISQNNSQSTSIAPPLVIVGYDRRFLSAQFAERASEVLAGNHINMALFETDVPTPLVSWCVREQRATGGIVITASHNPPSFNGFKIKAPWGGSATADTTSAVESLVDNRPPQRAGIPSASSLHTEILASSTASYRAHVASYIDLARLRHMSARVIVDPMHGTGGRWVESFLEGSALEVETIRAERDALFGGIAPEPIDRNLDSLKRRVRETDALVGLATDGDADRVGAVGDDGETMTMHQVVPLLLLHLARKRGMTGGVVRTFSQSILTKRIADAHNFKVYDTPIGFKHIADLMLREDVLLGAEESGGIGVKGHIPERDGILNSLLLLEAIATTGKPPTEMVREMHREFGEFYFGRRDLHIEVSHGQSLVSALASSPPTKFAGHSVCGIENLDGAKLLFDDESWLLFRQSGTEPVLRIYSEATSTAKMNALLESGAELARKAVVSG